VFEFSNRWSGKDHERQTLLAMLAHADKAGVVQMKCMIKFT
jgi:hypothetical protein